MYRLSCEIAIFSDVPTSKFLILIRSKNATALTSNFERFYTLTIYMQSNNLITMTHAMKELVKEIQTLDRQVPT